MTPIDCRWPAPPDDVSLAAGDVHLWCAPLDVSPAAVEEFRALLSADERQRADRFRPGPLCEHFIAGRGVLRQILSRYLGVGAGRLGFQYTARGKPALAPPFDQSGVQFNLSHSRGLALFAVAAGREVGVDVEWPRPMRHLAGMARRCFSTAEKRQWRTLAEEDRPAGFFRAWTCKEAWLKATGAGFSFPLSGVSVSLLLDQQPRLLDIQGDCRAAAQWHLEAFEPAAGYVAALAVQGTPPRLSLWRRTGTVPIFVAGGHKNGTVPLDQAGDCYDLPIPDDPGRRGAVAIILRGGKMLVIRRAPTVVAPLMHCFPGGGIEPGEAEESALVREIQEELGVTVQPLRRLWHCVTSWKVELAWWLAELDAAAALRPNPAEVESVQWCTPAEMAALPGLLESNRLFLEELRQGRITFG